MQNRLIALLVIGFIGLFSACAEPELAYTGPPIDGDVVDGDESDGDLFDGDWFDGDVADGDEPDGDLTDGDLTDGDLIDGDVTDGDLTDGDLIDGDVIDGDVIDGDVIDGDVIDGDVIDGDVIDGDVIDGDVIDGDLIDGDVIDGDQDPTCRYYVDAAADPLIADGLSWETAYDALQPAINAATASVPQDEICEVWVAGGLYEVCATCATDSVQMRHRVYIYGGFHVGDDALDQRDWLGNRSILSGVQSGSSDTAVYHVVRGDAQNALLDGFVLQGGEAIGEGVHSLGGGILIEAGTVSFNNLIIRDNLAAAGGGAIAMMGGTATMSNVTMQNNRVAKGSGSAIYVYSATLNLDGGLVIDNTGAPVAFVKDFANLNVSNTTFENNSAGMRIDNARLGLAGVSMSGHEAEQGGAVYAFNARVFISDSRFLDNHALASGGALFIGADSTLVDSGSLYAGNSSDGDGGAVALLGAATSTIQDVVFANNSSGGNGGALSGQSLNQSLLLADVSFVDNDAAENGGAIRLATTTPASNETAIGIERMLASGNQAGQSGGALALSGPMPLAMRNMDVVRNRAGLYGGGLYVSSGNGYGLIGSTLTANLSSSASGGVTGKGLATDGGAVLRVVNCILWDNATSEILMRGGSSVEVYYSIAIGLGGAYSYETVSSSPQFVSVNPFQGTWQSLSYDSASDTTRLVASVSLSAAGIVDSWTSGIYVQAKDTDSRWLIIADADATSITVWGDVRDWVSVGDTWRLYSTYLLPNSPAIDRGFGDLDWAGEADIAYRNRADASSVANTFDCTNYPNCLNYVDIGSREYQPLSR
jgi:predicted outer membrane repeat protein